MLYKFKQVTEKDLKQLEKQHDIAHKDVCQKPGSKEKRKVYNLTVDGGLYFANEILVHNCASFAICNHLVSTEAEAYHEVKSERERFPEEEEELVSANRFSGFGRYIG